MSPPRARTPRVAPFTEKSFYLAEFRDRTLAIAAPARAIASWAPLEPVLKELEANRTDVLLCCDDADALARLPGTRVLPLPELRIEGVVWRALRGSPRVGLLVRGVESFPAAVREIAVRLRVSKLVWLDRAGGLREGRSGRHSFVDQGELSALIAAGLPGEPPERLALVREIERALQQGLGAVNLCNTEGLADELFTYAGSGTLFTRERYVDVRSLGIDDFDAADDLIARGVAEGYLAPRSPEQLDQVFACGVGAFVEGRHLAGIGALLPYDSERAGEIASLYTLTRFLGEGIGSHLIAALCARACARGYAFVFACTTTERVAGFFERQGFRRVPPDEVPAEKWRDYDRRRRPRVRCLRRELSEGGGGSA
ncbi:MAG TPA: GNAT family N-acetyltransferase [Myxococcota bacterium]|nr:GNAT family N-acetyltransferase [Myxococcota bacterium]